MQLQIKAQDAGVKRDKLDATTNKAEDAGVKRGTLDATTNKGTRCRCKERTNQMTTTNKGTRCRCKERHIKCNYK